ncbi:MAG: DNA repair protein RecO [Bacteroidota bacterium]
MLAKTTGVVFRFIKYGDTSIIVNIFTSQFGLQSYIVNGVRSRTGKGKIALYQPLTLLELVVYHKETTTIMRIKEAKCIYAFQQIHGDVKKTTIALFIEELINKSIREEAHAAELCDFLITSLITLDKSDRPENFHLIFMIQLAKHLGFQPQNAQEVLGGRVMDFDEEKSLNLILKDSNVILTNSQRRNILDALLRFYSMHVENFGTMKSLSVLREILS